MSTKYVVTGGAGFVGSALVRGLIAADVNCTVAVVDNLSTGTLNNIADISNRVAFHNIDIRSPADLAAVIQGSDVVFHEAALASVPLSIDQPEECHTVNVNGTVNVLLAALRGGVRRVVFASSCAVYGDSTHFPILEDTMGRPKSPYALQKAIGEDYCQLFTALYGLDTVCLRYFNIYGPRQRAGDPYSGVVPLFIKALLNRVPPTIYGDGLQSRDLVFVEDVVAANILASQAEGVAGQVFNCGSGATNTVNDIWDRLQELGGVHLPAHYDPLRLGEIRHSQGDISAARVALGYLPRYSIEAGLRATYEWYLRRAQKR